MRGLGARHISLLLAAGALCAALAGAGQPGAAAAGSPVLPAHVYAPYFEAWTHDSVSAAAERSGARYLTLAFVQTAARGSCTLTWNGDPSQPITAGRYRRQIAALRAMGGDVVISFGGYSADHTGEEIADSCHSIAKIAAAYESVVTTYGVTRLDMDVEDHSLNYHAAIDRRNKAINLLEAWAARQGRTVQIVYTLPVEPAGLQSNGMNVLRDAVANGTRVSVVNAMVFDYYDGTTQMGTAAIRAANGVHRELGVLYPALSSAQRWAMVGLTLLPGIDDNPTKMEVTTLADTRRILGFARSRGIGELSIWAIQRDNGACPGQIDSNSCSGVVQTRWAFSHLLEPFTG